MALTLDPDEVLAFSPDLDPKVVDILIRDGLAMARRVAPCIDDDDFPHVDAATAIIRSAVLRWAESGGGAVSSNALTAGPFGQTVSYDTRQSRRSLFFPKEIRALEGLCGDSRKLVGAIDTAPTVGSAGCGGSCGYLFGSAKAGCAHCGALLNRGLLDE